jgi:hypothetical protein
MDPEPNEHQESFSAAGVTFSKPADLDARVATLGAVQVVRLGNPAYMMELNIMVGPLMEVVAIATPTKMSFHPPEGGGLTRDAARTIGNLFLGALAADSAVSTGGDVKTFVDDSGTTSQGYSYAVRGFTCMPDDSVAQCAALVFDRDRPTVAVVAYRGHVKHRDEMERWKEEIVQSLTFANAA